MKRKFLIILVIIAIFVTGCGKKKEEDVKKNLEHYDFNLVDYGINSKIYYDKKVYDKFEIDSSNTELLVFEDTELKIKFSLTYALVDGDGLKEREEEISNLGKYKSFEFGKYKGYIYSPEGSTNFANVVLKLNEDKENYYVAFIDAYSTDSSEKDYVFDSLSSGGNFANLVSNLEFKFNTEKYIEFINSNNDVNNSNE